MLEIILILLILLYITVIVLFLPILRITKQYPVNLICLNKLG